MRDSFANAVISIPNKDEYFFLTGDLGFMALEEVRRSYESRFVNAGVAEQNMIGVAAGLAKEGFKVFAYSIAPFCYARPFEQIRNDICFGNLPVCLVGNGGGYAYGNMGPTHHALEDCAAMNALGVRVLVPAFNEDIPFMIKDIMGPTYLRLGYDVRPKDTSIPPYKPWREVLTGEDGVIVALGPLAGLAWQAFLEIDEKVRPAVWAVTEFKIDFIPEEFWKKMCGRKLFVIEEHVASGGLGMNLAFAMTKLNISASKFIHRFAKGYPSKTFGSQNFHRAESGIDIIGIHQMVRDC